MEREPKAADVMSDDWQGEQASCQTLEDDMWINHPLLKRPTLAEGRLKIRRGHFFFSFMCLIIQIPPSHLLKFLMHRPELALVIELCPLLSFFSWINLVNSKTLNVKVISQILTKGIPSDGEVPALT